MKGSRFDHRGYEIYRNPVPVEILEEIEGKLTPRETTGYEFVVYHDGLPLDINVTALNRHLGLKEVKEWIDRQFATQAAAETDIVSAQSN